MRKIVDPITKTTSLVDFSDDLTSTEIDATSDFNVFGSAITSFLAYGGARYIPSLRDDEELWRIVESVQKDHGERMQLYKTQAFAEVSNIIFYDSDSLIEVTDGEEKDSHIVIFFPIKSESATIIGTNSCEEDYVWIDPKKMEKEEKFELFGENDSHIIDKCIE